jgi:Zn finger protein HypA/HybF involved in hydrogenase expression
MNSTNYQRVIYYDSSISQKSYDLRITLKRMAAAPVRTRISNEINFLICQSCLWCASYFNLIELTVISCPQCRSNDIEQIPISDN